MRRVNNDLRKDVLKLQSEARKRERTLKSTELKTKQVANKLRGTKSASTKLKRQLKENDENVKKPRYSYGKPNVAKLNNGFSFKSMHRFIQFNA